MSGIANTIKNTIHSGEPGSSGREVFEDSTASGPASQFAQHGNTGASHIGGLGQHSIATTGNDEHGNLRRDVGAHHEGSAVRGAEGAMAGMTGSHQHGHQQGGVMRGAENAMAGMTGNHQHDDNCGHGLTGNAVQGGGFTPREHEGVGHQASNMGRPEGAAGARGIEEAERHHHQHHENTAGGGGLLDRTGPGGPVTGGAAGTDRFDSDRHRTGAGNESSSGLLSGNHGGHADHSDRTPESSGAKASGGLMGMLTTSDKEFTGKDTDRLPNSKLSAYSDDSGLYKSNTSGPGGASSLTGREGNFTENPTGHHNNLEGGVHGKGVTGTHGTSTEEGLRNTSGPGHTVAGDAAHHGQAGQAEHKGLLAKVKDAIM